MKEITRQTQRGMPRRISPPSHSQVGLAKHLLQYVILLAGTYASGPIGDAIQPDPQGRSPANMPPLDSTMVSRRRKESSRQNSRQKPVISRQKSVISFQSTGGDERSPPVGPNCNSAAGADGGDADGHRHQTYSAARNGCNDALRCVPGSKCTV